MADLKPGSVVTDGEAFGTVLRVEMKPTIGSRGYRIVKEEIYVDWSNRFGYGR